MKKFNPSRIMRFFKQPFKRSKQKREDLQFADSKRKELEMLSGPCAEFYHRTGRPLRISQINTDVQSLVDFSRYFIRETFKEPELQEKLLSNLEGFELRDEPRGDVSGACGCSVTKGAFVIDKWVWIGDIDENLNCDTDIDRIKTWMHENAHATSQKHDLESFVNVLGVSEELLKSNPEAAVRIHSQSIKDHSIGEIESLFMEKVFRHFLATKASKIVSDGMNMGLSASELEEEAFNLQQVEHSSFLGAVDFVKRPKHDKHTRKDYMFRYVVGEVGSRILFEKYLENPEEAIRIYGEFLKTNAQLNIDEAMSVLSGGELHSYPEAMDKFRSIFEKKLQALKEKNSSEDNDDELGEND